MLSICSGNMIVAIFLRPTRGHNPPRRGPPFARQCAQQLKSAEARVYGMIGNLMLPWLRCLAWLLQGLFLLFCCKLSGSVVRASDYDSQGPRYDFQLDLSKSSFSSKLTLSIIRQLLTYQLGWEAVRAE